MNSKITKINNKKFKSKKNNKTVKIVNKCLVKKSTLEPLPLLYFKKLSTEIFKILEENNDQTKNKYLAILKTFPFCEKNDKNINYKFNNYLKSIFKNNLFDTNEKKRRITSALINMAYEYITTKNADIGTLSDNTTNPHNLQRPIKEEYEYYKNVHHLEENKYNYY